ncbi:MAG: glycosyltransferase family 39 protein [Saprospiraceae bacterium]|nr:glycosyltransferase family 39 protein [Saprospiraceae bacterium]
MNLKKIWWSNDLKSWIVALITILAGLYTWPLFDQDEAAYAGFAMNMLQSGDFWSPEFIWSDVHRKTPLHFWMIALCYKLFGYGEFTTRIPALLSIIGVCYLVWSFLKRNHTSETANLVLLILSGNALLGVYARMSVTDGPLLFFQTLAALSIIRFAQTSQYKYAWIHMIALSLGMLQKGPAMLIFSGILGLTFIIFSRQGRKMIHPAFLGIQLISFAPVLLWGYQAWQKDNGTMIRWMIDWYILNRVGESVFGQTGPPGYHLVLIVLTFLLLIPVLIFTFARLAKQIKAKDFSNFPYLLWALAAWIPFEFTASKLPSYALGAYPALAILMGIMLQDMKSAQIKWSFYWNIFLLLGIVVSLWVFDIAMLRSVSWHLTYSLFLLGVLTVRWIQRSEFAFGNIALLQNAFIMLMMFIFTIVLRREFSIAKQLSREIPVQAETIIYLDTTILYYPSLPLYLEWQWEKKPQVILESPETSLDMSAPEDLYIFSLESYNKLPIIQKEAFNVQEFSGLNTGRAGNLELRVLQRKQ